MGRLIKIWSTAGNGVIYEYSREEGNPRQTPLTYENERGRDYYKVGDFVLVGMRTRQTLEEWFPVLRSSQSDEPSSLQSLMGITLAFLGWEEPKYAVAWRIEEIIPKGAGNGVAKMKRFVFLDKETPVPLDTEPVVWFRDELHTTWVMSLYATDWKENIVPLANAVGTLAKIGVDMITGGFTTILKLTVLRYGAKQLVKRGLTKFARVLIRVFSNALVGAGLKAFATLASELAKELTARNDQERLRIRLASASAFRGDSFQAALLRATSSAAETFASSLISTLETKMMGGIATSMEEVLGLATGSLKKRVAAFLVKEVTKLFTTEAFKNIVQALSKAVIASIDSTGRFDAAQFSKVLVDELQTTLSALFTVRVNSWTVSLAEWLATEFAR